MDKFHVHVSLKCINTFYRTQGNIFPSHSTSILYLLRLNDVLLIHIHGDHMTQSIQLFLMENRIQCCSTQGFHCLFHLQNTIPSIQSHNTCQGESIDTIPRENLFDTEIQLCHSCKKIEKNL